MAFGFQAMYQTSRCLGIRKAGGDVDDDADFDCDEEALGVSATAYIQRRNAIAVVSGTDGRRPDNAVIQPVTLKEENSLEKEGIHMEQHSRDGVVDAKLEQEMTQDAFDAETVVLPGPSTKQTLDNSDNTDAPSPLPNVWCNLMCSVAFFRSDRRRRGDEGDSINSGAAPDPAADSSRRRAGLERVQPQLPRARPSAHTEAPAPVHGRNTHHSTHHPAQWLQLHPTKDNSWSHPHSAHVA